MKRILFLLFLVACCCYGFGQECYKQTRQRGIELYNTGKKESAQKAFQAAKACPDKPSNDDLDAWISKCKKPIQKEKCYATKYKKAIKLYEYGDKQSAKKLFVEARNCWDKPQQNDLKDWISKCEQNKPDPEMVTGCYVENYNKGLELYYKGNKKKAKELFIAAKSCPDKPANNILEKLIHDCDEADSSNVDTNSVTLLSGTSIHLKSNYTILARKVKRYDNIYFTVTEDIKVQGRTVIPQGSIAIGVVKKAKRSSAFGTKGKLYIEMSRIDVGNEMIKLNYKMLRFYGKNNTPIAVIAGLCFTPCFFITGTKAYMPADYEFVVTTSDNEIFYLGN